MLLEQLGRGGAAPVWLAREVYGATELRTAAVKLFALGPSSVPARGGAPPGVEGETVARARRDRIVEEARALCRVQHPNVVRFYALPMDEALGVMGLAMEHVAGASLARRLAERGALSVAAALDVGVAIASALSAVHLAGLVHRDVKPSNIVEAAGVYKLIDFGIAAADAPDSPEPSDAPGPPDEAGQAGFPGGSAPAADSASSGRDCMSSGRDSTSSGRDSMSPVVGRTPDRSSTLPVAAGPGDGSTLIVARACGTPGYIDPCCVAGGREAVAASDLYALGVTLHQCLTGQAPTVDTPPRPLRELAPDLPPALARIVDALISPDRRARPPSAEWLAVRLEQIRDELAGAPRAVPPESIGPFRGLGRFEERDRDVYFGRRAEVAAVLSTLRARSVVALVGPSGSGKSSLARAGVLPAIVEGALGSWPASWDTAIAEPGDDPRAALLGALSPFLAARELASPEAAARALAARADETGRGLVLLLDQLEELVTIAPGAARSFAASLVARIGEQSTPGLRAIVCVRRDLLDPVLALPEVGGALVKGMILVEPVAEPAWRTIVDQALAAYGYRFEDEALRAEVLAELEGTADAMPLVQFALTMLWEKRDARRKILPRAGLRAIGGIAGALERHAEATLAELALEHPGAAEATRDVLLALTTAQGTRVMRAADEVVRSGLPAAREVVEAFERARLLVPSGGGITLAHEALLSRWSRLRKWVSEVREDRVLAEELERDAAAWAADPDGVPFWRRRRLAFGEDLARRGTVGLSPSARSFLASSRRAERRVRLLAAAASAAVAASIAGAGASYVASLRAEERAAQALLAKERDARRMEQEGRRIAEERTREVERKQATIDELMRRLSEEQDREQKREIEAKIRREVASSRRASLEPPPQTAAPIDVEGAAVPAPSALPTALPPKDWK